MMAPDYAHWHGMYEVAERFYMELIPQAREIADHAAAEGKTEQAAAVTKVIDEILARPEHQWMPSRPGKEVAEVAPVRKDVLQSDAATSVEAAEPREDNTPPQASEAKKTETDQENGANPAAPPNVTPPTD